MNMESLGMLVGILISGGCLCYVSMSHRRRH